MREIFVPDRLIDSFELVVVRLERRAQRFEIGAGRLPCLVHIIDKPLRIGPGHVAGFSFPLSKGRFEKNAGFAIVASTSFWMENESLRLSKIRPNAMKNV